MSDLPDSVLIAEGGFTLIFFVLLLVLRRKMGTGDCILWGLVWITRALSSLSGSRSLYEAGADLTGYISLQGCSALALAIIVAREEARVVRERMLRGIWAQITGLYTGRQDRNARAEQEAGNGQKLVRQSNRK